MKCLLPSHLAIALRIFPCLLSRHAVRDAKYVYATHRQPRWPAASADVLLLVNRVQRLGQQKQSAEVRAATNRRASYPMCEEARADTCRLQPYTHPGIVGHSGTLIQNAFHVGHNKLLDEYRTWRYSRHLSNINWLNATKLGFFTAT